MWQCFTTRQENTNAATFGHRYILAFSCSCWNLQCELILLQTLAILVSDAVVGGVRSWKIRGATTIGKTLFFASQIQIILCLVVSDWYHIYKVSSYALIEFRDSLYQPKTAHNRSPCAAVFRTSTSFATWDHCFSWEKCRRMLQEPSYLPVPHSPFLPWYTVLA